MTEEGVIGSIPIMAIWVFSKNNKVFKQQDPGDWQVIPFEWTSVNLR